MTENEIKEKRVYAAEVKQWVNKVKISSLVGMGASICLPVLYDGFTQIYYPAIIVLFAALGWLYIQAIKKEKYLVEKYQI